MNSQMHPNIRNLEHFFPGSMIHIVTLNEYLASSVSGVSFLESSMINHFRIPLSLYCLISSDSEVKLVDVLCLPSKSVCISSYSFYCCWFLAIHSN